MQRIFLVLCVALAASVASGCDGSDGATPSAQSKDANWVAYNQGLIRSLLKDPSSAAFRNTFVSRATGSPMVCGEVNAKNSFGGYVGYKRFIAGGSTIQLLESDMAPGEMNKTWAKICAH